MFTGVARRHSVTVQQSTMPLCARTGPVLGRYWQLMVCLQGIAWKSSGVFGQTLSLGADPIEWTCCVDMLMTIKLDQGLTKF